MQISAEGLKKLMEQTWNAPYLELCYHAKVFNEIKVILARNMFDALKNISVLSHERRKIFDSSLPYISVKGISFRGG